MTCSTCQHWSPRKSREMARQGFASCALGVSYTFFPPQHTCEKHEPATKAIQADRVKWLASMAKPVKVAKRVAESPAPEPWWVGP